MAHSTASTLHRHTRNPHSGISLVAAVASAATFGTSGTLARPLLDAGWSPGAAVALRTGCAGLLLAPLAWRSMRGNLGSVLSAWRRVVAFGALGVIGAQLFYFAAVERLPVGIAILIEFLGPVLLVVATSARRRRLPPRTTVIGAAVSVGGLALVLDLTGDGRLDALGVVFALIAATGIAGYFHVAGRPGGDVAPVALASAGLLFGAVGLAVAGVIGVVPFSASTLDVDLFGSASPWWVPMGLIVVVSTAFPYATGVFAAERLGATVASFVALLEVVFAVVAAWVLLGEVPRPIQGVGGLLVLVGVALVRLEGRTGSPLPLEVVDERPGLGTDLVRDEGLPVDVERRLVDADVVVGCLTDR